MKPPIRVDGIAPCLRTEGCVSSLVCPDREENLAPGQVPGSAVASESLAVRLRVGEG